MKRIIVALVVLMFALPAFAGMSTDSVHNAGWNKLTETQKAAIIQQVANDVAKLDTSVSTVTDPDKLGKWVDLGTKMGQMIGGAAKQLGIAANEFVNTPVGMVTMGLIVWHYMGGALVHILGGLFLFTVGMSFILYLARIGTKLSYVYDDTKKDIFGRAVLKEASRSQLTTDTVTGLLVSAGVVTVASLFTVFSF